VDPQRYLVTGGAGFIGTNLVERLVSRGHQVTIYDNLSRRGARINAAWLRERYPDLRWLVEDVRDFEPLKRAAADADVIVHLASQVAVTTSVTNPREDFEINALGTFNVVEAARLSPRPPIVLYASTNKVYGGMEDVVIVEEPTRYAYRDLPYGVPETYPLDFHSPYGVSKGTGDQYVRDYARIYSLRTVVFRQSAIYGPRQFGEEDQGWAAWFAIAAVTGRPITIYGDGKQVRDMLHVSDLIDAYEIAVDRIDQVRGRVYNVGGGPANTTSIWTEFAPLLEEYLGRAIPVRYEDHWRPGDQKVCVMDVRKAARELGWSPKIRFSEGLRQLVAWVQANRALFA